MTRFLQSRVPTFVTVTILAAALSLTAKLQKDRKVLLAQKESLVEKARTQGFTPGDPIPLSTRRTDEDPLKKAERITANFIAYALRFKGDFAESEINKLDQATRDGLITQMDEVMALNHHQIAHLLAIIAATPDLNGIRGDLLRFAINRLNDLNPFTALNLLKDNSLLTEHLGSYAAHIARSASASWCLQNPDQALAWLRQSRHDLPDDFVKSVASSLLHHQATQDPLGVFPLLHEFAQNPTDYFPYIFRERNLTIDECQQAFPEIRKLAEDLDPEKRQEFLRESARALVLGQIAHQADFETATAIASSSIFTPDELEFLWNPGKADLEYKIRLEDTPRWITWLQSTFPPEQSNLRVRDLIERWTKRDPAAAQAFAREHGLTPDNP